MQIYVRSEGPESRSQQNKSVWKKCNKTSAEHARHQCGVQQVWVVTQLCAQPGKLIQKLYSGNKEVWKKVRIFSKSILDRQDDMEYE